MAVSEKAIATHLIVSCARRSYLGSPVRSPSHSATTMNIGAPKTKAAKNRCSCATSHIAVRAPISGKSSGISLFGELRGRDQRDVHAALVVIRKRATDLVFPFLEGDFEVDGTARAEFRGVGIDPRPLDMEVMRKTAHVAQHEGHGARFGADLVGLHFVFRERDFDPGARNLDKTVVRRGLAAWGPRCRRPGLDRSDRGGRLMPVRDSPRLGRRRGTPSRP